MKLRMTISYATTPQNLKKKKNNKKRHRRSKSTKCIDLSRLSDFTIFAKDELIKQVRVSY